MRFVGTDEVPETITEEDRSSLGEQKLSEDGV
jgi:hypothetical protein